MRFATIESPTTQAKTEIAKAHPPLRSSIVRWKKVDTGFSSGLVKNSMATFPGQRKIPLAKSQMSEIVTAPSRSISQFMSALSPVRDPFIVLGPLQDGPKRRDVGVTNGLRGKLVGEMILETDNIGLSDPRRAIEAEKRNEGLERWRPLLSRGVTLAGRFKLAKVAVEKVEEGNPFGLHVLRWNRHKQGVLRLRLRPSFVVLSPSLQYLKLHASQLPGDLPPLGAAGR
jgi:hypothetical protein